MQSARSGCKTATLIPRTSIIGIKEGKLTGRGRKAVTSATDQAAPAEFP